MDEPETSYAEAPSTTTPSCTRNNDVVRLSAVPIILFHDKHKPLQVLHQHCHCCPNKLTLALQSLLPWQKVGAVLLALVGCMALALATMPPAKPHYNIAFVGNSMMYYNDFPRFMEALSGNKITQDCCLHGDAALTTILTWGSGVYQIWHTGVARITNDLDAVLYDMGACTVAQLLFGYDEALEEKVQNYEGGYNNYDDDNTNNDDYASYYDGKNPCLQNPSYYYYKQQVYNTSGVPQWNFVILNDRTRSPARAVSRNETLQVLEDTYLPWFQETGATPIFLVTYGYDSPYRDMSGGLGDVANFTSLTHEGYRQYAKLLQQYLPKSQTPRLAPVGLAFLMVYEENYALWQKLFHIDQIHASPHGTFLQGCVVHHTIYGRLPDKRVALVDNMSSLWNTARRMQPRKHRRMPMPTREEAEYLYHIAERVTVRKQYPKTFIHYQHGEASDYVPQDGKYADNDIYR